MTYIELCEAMQSGKYISINGHIGFINAIQREDSSGYCWNITMSTDEGNITTFVRTVTR